MEPFALLDTASEVTLIKTSLVKRLKLQERPTESQLGSFHGQDPEIPTTATSLTISASDHSITYWVEDALTIP